MALNIFPHDREPNGLAGAVPLFTDAKLAQRAQLYDLNGVPLVANVIYVRDRRLPEFQAAAGLLYGRAEDGTVVALAPMAQRVQPIVTGSKGANAALTSLMAALSQLGIVVDQTS